MIEEATSPWKITLNKDKKGTYRLRNTLQFKYMYPNVILQIFWGTGYLLVPFVTIYRKCEHKQYWIFQLILHILLFYVAVCEQYKPQRDHIPLQCVFIKVNFKKKNTSMSIKISSSFLENHWEMVLLARCHLTNVICYHYKLNLLF